MMESVRPGLRRILALAILIAALALIWGVAVVPLQNRFEQYSESISQSRALLARHNQIIASKDVLQANIERIKQSRILKNGFFQARSTEIATADIQKIVKNAVEKSGATLVSVQVLPPEMEKGFQKIGVRVRMSGQINSLQSTLYVLETSWPLLFIDELDVRVRTSRRTRRRQRADEDGHLRIHFDATGYLRRMASQPVPNERS